MPKDTPAPGSPTGNQGKDASDEPDFLDSGSSRYKTKEDAVAGMKSKDDMISQVSQQNKELEAQLEMARQNTAQFEHLADVIATSTGSADTNSDTAARLEELREKVRIDPGAAIDVTGEVIRELETKVAGDSKASMAALETKQQEILAALASQVANQDPSYLANKEHVDDYEDKYGLTREKAIALAQDLHPVDHAQTPTPQSTSGSARHTQDALTDELDPGVKQLLRDNYLGDMTPEEIAQTPWAQ